MKYKIILTGLFSITNFIIGFNIKWTDKNMKDPFIPSVLYGLLLTSSPLLYLYLYNNIKED